MIVPKRILANNQISQSSVIYFNSTIFLFPSNMEIDISVNSILRGRSNLTYKSNSRSSLVFSSVSSIFYHECMECYELKSLELDKRTTLVLSDTRELNRDSFTN